MPIDSAAPAYHWSALKMTRRLRFLAARDRVVGFLAPTGFVLVFFDICAPVPPTLIMHHSSGHDVVTEGPKKSLTRFFGLGNPKTT